MDNNKDRSFDTIIREKDSMEMSPETSKRSYTRFCRLNSISKILIKAVLMVFNSSDDCGKHRKRFKIKALFQSTL